jgi:phosphohistidine phosphatase SixA
VKRLAFLCVASLVLAACGADADERAAGGPAELVEALRGGGYVLYLRHTATDQAERDQLDLGAALHDCSRQRNLTDAGREQARRIGEAIRALGIPTGPVVASEYCRTLETARLAFDRVVPDPLLTGIALDDEPDRERRVEALRELLSEPPSEGSNRVVVGHVMNLRAAAGIEIDEGETAVFEARGDDGFELAGRIPAAAWPQLAEALGER